MFEHQKVRLIAVTKPVSDDFVKDSTAENLIVYCARVSNPSNQSNTQTGAKLLKYCIDHEHWSIFEMAHVVIEINTTRDIARQILRHRSFSFQEFSQRYADASELGFASRQARLQDHKNRQNSIEMTNTSKEQQELNKAWFFKQEQLIHETKLAYKWALDNGIAKEQARAVLPEGMTMSRMYMAGSLRSWLHYCNLRRANGTQKEHQDIAEKCWIVLKEEFSFLKEEQSQ